ncbi:MAG: beta-lactamase family protein [Butyrivibrio sp.]|nr:beta-lactamase family protein [Butyrivibrio sp.]
MNFDKLTAYIDGLEKEYGVPACDCIVTKDHEVVYRHMAGHSDLEKTQPITENALYRLFSATKVITMTAVLQLIERGELGLYDQLTDYIPEFGRLRVADEFKFEFPLHWPTNDDPCHLAHNSIRIIDLMTMTAGMNYDTFAPELMAIKEKSNDEATTIEVVKEMAKMPLLYDPGTSWGYSLAHDVLAAVIEVVTGMTFGEYLKKNIFEPIGVSDFYFTIDEAVKKRLPAMYAGEFGTTNIKPDDGVQADSFKITKNYESGGAGLIASVADYSVFIDALANNGVAKNGNRILSEDSIKMFMTPYTTGVMQEQFDLSGKVGYSYGLGVRVLTDNSKSKSPLGEFGWDGAAGAYVMADPINKVSIFYAQHIMGFPVVYSEIHPKLRDLVYEGLEA